MEVVMATVISRCEARVQGAHSSEQVREGFKEAVTCAGGSDIEVLAYPQATLEMKVRVLDGLGIVYGSHFSF